METPIACTTASSTVKYLVYCAIFFLPSVPSLASRSSDGTAIVKSCSIMEAVIYGVMITKFLIFHLNQVLVSIMKHLLFLQLMQLHYLQIL